MFQAEHIQADLLPIKYLSNITSIQLQIVSFERIKYVLQLFLHRIFSTTKNNKATNCSFCSPAIK